jgi:hypothetical protein
VTQGVTDSAWRRASKCPDAQPRLDAATADASDTLPRALGRQQVEPQASQRRAQQRNGVSARSGLQPIVLDLPMERTAAASDALCDVSEAPPVQTGRL